MTTKPALRTEGETAPAYDNTADVVNSLELAIHCLAKVDVSVDEAKHVWNGLVAGIANLPDRTHEEIEAILAPGWTHTPVSLPAPPEVEKPPVEPPLGESLSGDRPDQGLPGDRPDRPGQGLPGFGPRPGQELPETPEPKGGSPVGARKK